MNIHFSFPRSYLVVLTSIFFQMKDKKPNCKCLKTVIMPWFLLPIVNHCPQLAYVPLEVAEEKTSWFSYISHCVKGKLDTSHHQHRALIWEEEDHICSMKCKLPRFEVLLSATRPLPLQESLSPNTCCFPVRSWRHTSPFCTLKETPFLSVDALPGWGISKSGLWTCQRKHPRTSKPRLHFNVK